MRASSSSFVDSATEPLRYGMTRYLGGRAVGSTSGLDGQSKLAHPDVRRFQRARAEDFIAYTPILMSTTQSVSRFECDAVGK